MALPSTSIVPSVMPAAWWTPALRFVLRARQTARRTLGARRVEHSGAAQRLDQIQGIEHAIAAALRRCVGRGCIYVVEAIAARRGSGNVGDRPQHIDQIKRVERAVAKRSDGVGGVRKTVAHQITED